jgi:hypothetical protein
MTLLILIPTLMSCHVASSRFLPDYTIGLFPGEDDPLPRALQALSRLAVHLPWLIVHCDHASSCTWGTCWAVLLLACI